MKSILCAVLALFVCLSASAGSGRIQKKKDAIAERYIVQFEASVSSPRSEAKAMAAQYGVKVRHVYQFGVTGFSMDATEAQAAAISADARVKTVEEDSRVQPLQVAPVTPPGWALDRINQRYLPLDHSAASGCNSGSGVRAYILDTGINPTTTEFGSPSRVIDAFTVDTANGPNYRDDWGLYGHGTPVASIVGGATWGVAKGVTLVNVKIVGPNYLGVEHAIAGFDFVIGEHLASPGVPKVINFSQAYAPSDLLDAKIREAVSLKIPVVVGAGNEGADPCNRDPGRVSQAYLGTPYTAANPSQYSVIAVGGSELINNYSQDQRYITSNYGACLDIFAPGAGVSALSKSGTRRAYNGTSMAAPLVTGAVARHLKNYIGYSPFPTAEGIENELKSMATVPSPAIPNLWGSPNLLLYTFNARCRSV